MSCVKGNCRGQRSVLRLVESGDFLGLHRNRMALASLASLQGGPSFRRCSPLRFAVCTFSVCHPVSYHEPPSGLSWDRSGGPECR